MKYLFIFLFYALFSAAANAQNSSDTMAIKEILHEEIFSWNKGDAVTYSQRFAENGTFTNILGMFFTGHQTFLDRHVEIFKGWKITVYHNVDVKPGTTVPEVKAGL